MTRYAHSADGFRCDECSGEMAIPLFCDHCGTSYPERRGMGPFSVLGLPETWGIDDDVFDQRELTLASRLHPDKWQGRGDRTHKRAQLAWSAVNEALAKTKDPFARAETLLTTPGEAPPKAQVPQMFLMEQLELQEEIEGGVGGDRRKILNKTIRRELKELRRQLAGHFEILEAAGGAGSAAGDAAASAEAAAK